MTLIGFAAFLKGKRSVCMFIDYKRLFVCELVLLCFPGLTFVSAVRVGALEVQMKPSPGSIPHPPMAAVPLAR